jgi:hypothetical protein
VVPGPERHGEDGDASAPRPPGGGREDAAP